MIETNQPESAFPSTFKSLHPEEQQVHRWGMTLRQYAAIQLKVPDSGADWLDDMIRKSLLDDFAAKAMDGFNRHMVAYEWGQDVMDVAARNAYALADAMLKAREA